MENSLLKGLIIKGNNKDAVRTILDAEICWKINNIKDTLSQLHVGYGDYVRTSKIEINPNVLLYFDSQSFENTEISTEGFRLILDTLIDIVEKIEAYTPSV